MNKCFRDSCLFHGFRLLLYTATFWEIRQCFWPTAAMDMPPEGKPIYIFIGCLFLEAFLLDVLAGYYLETFFRSKPGRIIGLCFCTLAMGAMLFLSVAPWVGIDCFIGKGDYSPFVYYYHHWLRGFLLSVYSCIFLECNCKLNSLKAELMVLGCECIYGFVIMFSLLVFGLWGVRPPTPLCIGMFVCPFTFPVYSGIIFVLYILSLFRLWPGEPCSASVECMPSTQGESAHEPRPVHVEIARQETADEMAQFRKMASPVQRLNPWPLRILLYAGTIYAIVANCRILWLSAMVFQENHLAHLSCVVVTCIVIACLLACFVLDLLLAGRKDTFPKSFSARRLVAAFFAALMTFMFALTILPWAGLERWLSPEWISWQSMFFQHGTHCLAFSLYYCFYLNNCRSLKRKRKAANIIFVQAFFLVAYLVGQAGIHALAAGRDASRLTKPELAVAVLLGVFVRALPFILLILHSVLYVFFTKSLKRIWPELPVKS